MQAASTCCLAHVACSLLLLQLQLQRNVKWEGCTSHVTIGIDRSIDRTVRNALLTDTWMFLSRACAMSLCRT